jgi:hypothetical protein
MGKGDTTRWSVVSQDRLRQNQAAGEMGDRRDVRFSDCGTNPRATQLLLLFLSVRGTVRDHPAYSSTWVFDIAWISRNHVDVNVVDSLPCCGPGIDSDVVPTRIVGTLDGTADCGNQTPECGLLSSGQGEEIGLVSPGHYESVPWAEWESVWEGNCTFVLEELNLVRNGFTKDTHSGRIKFGFAQRYQVGADTGQSTEDSGVGGLAGSGNLDWPCPHNAWCTALCNMKQIVRSVTVLPKCLLNIGFQLGCGPSLSRHFLCSAARLGHEKQDGTMAPSTGVRP